MWRRQCKFTRIVVIKIFAFSLPSQSLLGHHFEFHIFFHNSIPRDCTFFYSWAVLDTMNFKIDLCSGVWQCDAMTIEIVIWLTIVQSLPWARSCRIFDELFLIKPLCDTSNILYLILNYAERKAYSSIRSTLI